jgi:hypothetical protein
VGAVVELLPGRGVGQSVVGAAVQHQHAVRQLGSHLGAGAVRQCQDDDVVPGQDLGRGGQEYLGGDGVQMGVMLPQGRPGAGGGGEGSHLERRVTQQQPQHLTTGVPTGTRHGHPYRHDA